MTPDGTKIGLWAFCVFSIVAAAAAIYFRQRAARAERIRDVLLDTVIPI
jgi:phosphotransferase system  glucose/maltose/N-acetylglucosamine-specific IIC component